MNLQRKLQLEELLKEQPNDVFLLYALGLEYASEENFSSAIQTFEKCLSLDSQYIPAYYQIGMLFYKFNNIEQSLHYLKKGLEIAKNKKQLKDIAEFQSAITNIENDLL